MNLELELTKSDKYAVKLAKPYPSTEKELLPLTSATQPTFILCHGPQKKHPSLNKDYLSQLIGRLKIIDMSIIRKGSSEWTRG